VTIDKRNMHTRTLALLSLLLLSISAAIADTPRPKPTPASTNSCTTCKERRPTLDPAKFATGYEPEVKPGYEIARKYPATLDKIHCFCECAESPMFHHKTLLTCFTDLHAAGCGICLSEARLAGQLKDKGLSDEEIKVTIESVHRTDGHPATR
jgi:Protein of unknown function with PCYCGC motif